MKKSVVSVIAIFLFSAGNLTAQWTTLTTGTTYILYDISFPPGQSSTGYSGGMQYTYNAEGVVIKTTNGGDTWTEILGGSGTNGIEAVCFTSNDTGYVAGWNNYFIKTTDGGSSWTNITAGSDNWYFVDLDFWDADNGIAVANLNAGGSAIYVTDDAGATWTTATGVNINVQDAVYASADTLYAVGGDEKIIKSTDGGSSWTQIYTGTFQYYFFGVDFKGDFGVVGGEDGKIMHTTDGGTTWSTYATGYHNFYGVNVFNADSTYIGGTDEDVYKTTDGGTTWVIEDNGGGTSHIYKVKFTDNDIGFLCGSQGLIKRKGDVLIADFEADQTTICAGSSVNFTDLSVGATTWDWTFEGGTPASSTDQNPTVTYNAPGDYDVELTVTDGQNSSTKLKTEYISVLLTPAQANTPEGDTAVCTNNFYDYATSVVDYAEEYDWELFPADAGTLTGNGTTATLATALDWTGDFTIKVRATNICGDGAWSDSLEGNLIEAPEIFELSDGGEYCDGGSGVEISQDGSTIGVDYELFFEGTSTGTIIAGTDSAISYGYFTDEGNYTATGTNGACSDYMGGTAIITITYLPDPATTPIGDTSVCSGSTTDYTEMPIEGADTITWSLNPAEAGTITGGGEDITIAWAAGFEGLAYLTAQGENECGNGDESDELEINVSVSPTPEITGLSMVCESTEEEYTTEENEGSVYEWAVTGGEITLGDSTNQITVLWGTPGTGTVDLNVTVAGTCSGTAETMHVTIDECTGIEENNSDQLSIFPNPATDIINIKSAVRILSLRLYNLTGQKVAIMTPDKVSGTFDTSKLKPGMYFLVIETETGSTSKRIIIE
ncbi:MAG: YCF48-related protein [Bacteroidales bacterium]|nr:YCF48-related protein [Bacteroidales bacterium]